MGRLAESRAHSPFPGKPSRAHHPRREDGDEDYTKSDGTADPEGLYFTLPNAFWNEEWFARLRLAALAIFLIIAKETNAKREIYLTFKQFEDWYGISRKSAQAGVKQLDKEGLLHRRFEDVARSTSKTGWAVHVHYSLKGDFGLEPRKAAQTRAQKTVKARERAKKRRAVKATKTPSS